MLCFGILLACASMSHAFLPAQHAFVVSRQREFSRFLSMENDSESSSSMGWMESFKARQMELESKQSQQDLMWRKASCVSSIPVSLPDWVRRIDVEYPLVACGSASGAVFVAHLETGEVLAQSEAPEGEELEQFQSTLRIMYGSYDGGGTIAIAVHRNLICVANRQGSVQTYRYDKTSNKLISQGSMQALAGILVTCLELDDDNLWVGTSDGRLLVYPHEDAALPLAIQQEPFLEWNLGSTVLSLSISPEIGYGVVTTAKGSVDLFCMDDDEAVLTSWYPPFDSGSVRQASNTYPLSAVLVGESETNGYTIACGGSDGSLFLHPLNWKNDALDEYSPLKNGMVECKPKHRGPVKCLASPGPDLLISGGQDGTIRLWNVIHKSCLYQFIGYKVWLGSLWTDGRRLVSDGADNTVVLHDFDADAAQPEEDTPPTSEKD